MKDIRSTIRYRSASRTGRTGGWLLVEVIVSLAVLGILATVLAVAQSTSARLNKHILLRQRCLAAGQAQLDSIVATGKPISDKDLKRLWPGVRVEVNTEPGKGDWAGLTRLQVTAEATAGGRNIKVTLCRYVIDKATQ